MLLFVGVMVAICVWLAPGAEAGPASACGEAKAAPGRLSIGAMRTSELCLINRARVARDLHPLEANDDLSDSATGHSDSMVANRYFAHEGPGGSMDSRVSRAGYLARANAFTLGENIGGGNGPQGSPLAIFLDWMHSPPHRANILDPSFRDAGVGVSRGFPLGGGAGAATYTVDFGARSH